MELSFEAGVNREGKAFNKIMLDGEQIGQLDPAGMQALGLRAIQSGIEAERDAGLWNFLTSIDPGVDGQQYAAVMVTGLRRHRGQADPENPIHPNDPRVS